MGERLHVADKDADNIVRGRTDLPDFVLRDEAPVVAAQDADSDERYRELDNDVVLRSFEYAKNRYCRSAAVMDVEERMAAFRKERAWHVSEIDELRAVAAAREEVVQAAAAAYAKQYPHHVGRDGIEGPSLAERANAFGSANRLYQRFCRAAHRRDDTNAQLARHIKELAALERGMERYLERREAVHRTYIETAAGLAFAIRRDPLLQMARSRVLKTRQPMTTS
jgi:hypothetical protein